MKIMSFNVCSKDTWGVNLQTKEKWNLWKNYFKEIIVYNSPDIVFLQEVYIIENYIEDLRQTLGSEWNVFYTNVPGLNKNLNNAIFFKIACLDISEKYLQHQSVHKNCQVIKIQTKSKNIVGVNVHFKSDINSVIVPGSEHEKDLIHLCKLLNQLKLDYPEALIFAAGDFNYSYDLIYKYQLFQELLHRWILDDPNTQREGPALTTLKVDGSMGNCMDHFIYNEYAASLIEKQDFNNEDIKWNFTLGVLHLDKGARFLLEKTELSPIDYFYNISDHFPIVTEINC